MCQRSPRLFLESNFFSTTIDEHAIRRAYSAKSRSSFGSPERRTLYRRRPNSIHARTSVDIPMVNVHNSTTSYSRSGLSPEPRSRRNSRVQASTNKGSEELDEESHNHHSRSVSPHPLSRKELTISITGRTWKSEDVYPEQNQGSDHEMPNASTLSLRSDGMEQQLSVDATTSSHDIQKRPPKFVLSPKHKKILRSTFAQMNAGGTFLKLMEQVFRRLETKYPDIRSIFLTTAFVNSLSREKTAAQSVVRTEHDHCKCLVSMFEKIMENLNDSTTQLNAPVSIRTYGEKHAQMKESGMSGSMIENFGEIAVAVIASQDAIKYNHDAVKAWRLLLAYVTDEMMVGFDRSSRISERKCSANMCFWRT
ncbi:hypothetical protein GCK32_005885 [Trichostrongylus colubriformis]|uniref:Globin domain-containing protein n=1 Tax=Trichostrongylus colubriformis TaxID=6319 RepID=A0AAN8ILK0_TRICO